MSTARKVIKILSILTIVEGLCMAVIGILLMTGIFKLDDANAAYVELHLNGGNTTYLAIAVLLIAIFCIVEGWLGVKGANVPSKMFPFIIASTAAITYYCTEFLHTMLEGSIGFGMIGNLVVNGIVWYLAYKTYKEAIA